MTTLLNRYKEAKKDLQWQSFVAQKIRDSLQDIRNYDTPGLQQTITKRWLNEDFKRAAIQHTVEKIEFSIDSLSKMK